MKLSHDQFVESQQGLVQIVDATEGKLVWTDQLDFRKLTESGFRAPLGQTLKATLFVREDLGLSLY